MTNQTPDTRTAAEIECQTCGSPHTGITQEHIDYADLAWSAEPDDDHAEALNDHRDRLLEMLERE